MRVGAPGEGGFSIPVGEAERIAGWGQRLPIAIGGYWLNGEPRACALKPLVSSGSPSDRGHSYCR